MKRRVASLLPLLFALAACGTFTKVANTATVVLGTLDRVLSQARTIWERIKPFLPAGVTEDVITFARLMKAVDKSARAVMEAANKINRDEPVDNLPAIIAEAQTNAAALLNFLKELDKRVNPGVAGPTTPPPDDIVELESVVRSIR